MDIYLNVFGYQVPDKRRKLVDEPVNADLIGKNKFANNSAYVPESIYRRILNKMTNYQWSFVPHSIETIEGNKGYIQFIGLLIVPGFGVHTGIGTQPLNKGDNSKALAAAKTYAFKNACKEMGLAPNVGDKDFDEEVFENIDMDEIDDEDELDFSEDEEKKSKSKSKKEPAKDSKKKDDKPKAKKPSKIKDRIEEVRQAYELDSDDDFVAFIQIWDENILEIEDMDDEDWEDFLDYLEKNKDEFEDF